MSNNANASAADALRTQLPSIAKELDESIRVALEHLREARAQLDPHTETGRAGIRAIDFALRRLSPAQDAHYRFNRWLRDVVAMEPDACGLTPAERESLVGEANRAA